MEGLREEGFGRNGSEWRMRVSDGESGDGSEMGSVTDGDEKQKLRTSIDAS